MEYSALVSVYEDLAATTETLQKTSILADCFEASDDEHLPMLVKLVRGKLFANWRSDELGVSSSLAMDAICKASGLDEERIEDWWREQGDLGDAAARAIEAKTQQTLFSEPLTVREVHDTLQALAAYEGTGSQERRVDEIAGLLTAADPAEARYVVRTVVGAMRLGVGEGLIRDAIAWAFLDDSEQSIRAVERAYEVTNDFPLVATRAKSGGRAALEALDIEVFRPIKPMLSHNAESLEAAVTELADDGEVLVEVKYDGIRAKLHRDGDEVRMFTRRLEDVTTQFPDAIDAVTAAVDADKYILEAEVVGYDPETGEAVPFQELSRRIKRKYDIDEMVEQIPVTVHVFDCLLLDGDSLLQTPLRDRLAAVEAVFDPRPNDIERAAHVRTDSLDEVQSFYDDAVGAGQEGIMVKNLGAPYQPGSRVGFQLKVKSTMEPLDLVVTRAKWSEGRKSDYLGRPYLACRDEDAGRLREVGRMHTGFTDEQLEEFTDLVTPLIETVDGREAKLRPEVVLEVEYEEIQESPKYDSGFALRFPRLLGIRTDLDPEDADTFERVQRLYEQQH